MHVPQTHAVFTQKARPAQLSAHDSSSEAFPATPSIYVIKGERAILALQPLLIRFSETCGQPSAMQDLPYFLQKPGLLKRVPYLYLVARRAGIPPKEMRPSDLIGSLLLLEYRVLKIGTRAFATNDRSGRGTLLALPRDRLYVATRICEELMADGAAIAMLSFLSDPARQAQDEHLRLSTLTGMPRRVHAVGHPASRRGRLSATAAYLRGDARGPGTKDPQQYALLPSPRRTLTGLRTRLACRLFGQRARAVQS